MRSELRRKPLYYYTILEKYECTKRFFWEMVLLIGYWYPVCNISMMNKTPRADSILCHIPDCHALLTFHRSYYDRDEDMYFVSVSSM